MNEYNKTETDSQILVVTNEERGVGRSKTGEGD